MKKDIPYDGLGAADTTAGHDALSLLIMRQAFIDATEDAFDDERSSGEITDDYIDDYQEGE